ncbi:MAG: aminoacetone oxidase family FAD-binding enzyme, partial [Rhodobacteraceae bacterium]|nr:aminoacetone oxidase family FAD-binding enzyme [Paracoccaceae bacterium]
RISGGGRCNFTNRDTGPQNFIGENRHFHKSALARYTPWDFIDLLDSAGIGWHEKTLGQLFCDDKATQIVALLLDMVAQAGAKIWLETNIDAVRKTEQGFEVTLTKADKRQVVTARNLVVATGGKSIPKMGATGLAYQIATQFGLRVTETRPALVPFTFAADRFAPISGVAQPSVAKAIRGPAFAEAMLFTHRGLSGPAMLQISSYWQEGEEIEVDLFHGTDPTKALREARKTDPKKNFTTILSGMMPTRLVDHLTEVHDLSGNCAEWSDARIDRLVNDLRHWRLRPTGTEGYRTAEVTLGGVATDGLSSQTMEAKTVPSLYFIGECVDVTGWLGGFNFQWAWASGHAAALAIVAK